MNRSRLCFSTWARAAESKACRLPFPAASSLSRPIKLPIAPAVWSTRPRRRADCPFPRQIRRRPDGGNHKPNTTNVWPDSPTLTPVPTKVSCSMRNGRDNESTLSGARKDTGRTQFSNEKRPSAFDQSRTSRGSEAPPALSYQRGDRGRCACLVTSPEIRWLLSLRVMTAAPWPLMHTSRTPPCGNRSMAEMPTSSARQRDVT